MSKLSRRHLVMGGVALFLAGCQESIKTTSLPDIDWPDVGGRPLPGSGSYVPKGVPAPAPTPPVAIGNVQVLARKQWSDVGGPMRGREIYSLGKPTRITIHHEGYKVVDFTDAGSTAARLNLIRTSHVGKGWADIGYHFIVDRAGRVWEGRSIKYQGAHVRDHNEQNIGVMCLGNFDEQTPSTPQLNSLRETVQAIRQANGIRENMIFTHQEINPTACPGRHLQPRIVQMRRAHQFA